jgi:hypothetical protein
MGSTPWWRLWYLLCIFCCHLAIIYYWLSVHLIWTAKQNPESKIVRLWVWVWTLYSSCFDIRFCVIAILFIIFDIEIMFLIPWCASISKLDLLGFWSMIDFLFELGVGFFYVWYVSSRLGLIIYFCKRTKKFKLWGLRV